MQKEEEPLLLLRQHWATFLWPVLRTALLLGVTIPVMPYAFNYLWSTIVIIGWWIFVVVWALVSWFTWYFNITLVTSQRIIGIAQQGPFARRVREAPHDKVVEVTFQIKGLLPTIFGYGNVDVYFDGQDKPITIKAVLAPETVKDQLVKIKEYIASKSADSDQASLEKLAKLLKDNQSGHKVPVKVTKSNPKDGEIE